MCEIGVEVGEGGRTEEKLIESPSDRGEGSE